jgi:predicted phage terminase large subunit-like protein
VTFDDVENDQTAENPDQCKKISNRVWKAVRPALQRKKDGGFSMKWIGTPITEFTVTYQFMRETVRKMVKDLIPIVDADGHSAWPDVYDDAEIEGLRADDPDAWFSEYLLNPLSGSREFRDEWLRDCAELPGFGAGDVTYGAIDPSFGHTGDYKAIITLTGQRSSMNVFTRHAYIRTGTPRDMCQAIYDQQVLYDCEYAIEENTLKDFLWEAVEAFEKDKGVHLRLRPVYHGAEASKQDRIRRLISPMERGKVYFQKDHSDQNRLKEQFKTFPKGHDDGPDAFEEAYQQILKRFKTHGLRDQLQAGAAERATAELGAVYTDFDGYL